MASFRLANASSSILEEKEKKMAEKRMAKQKSELALCTFKPNLVKTNSFQKP